jgi:hypothetical protein
MCLASPLAPGSEAFALVTVHGGVEGDLVSTSIASVRATDGSRVERSALTTTRSRRSVSELTLRRPDAATIFRVGRNNTIQWTLRGTAGGVSIDLSRDHGATWTRLSENARPPSEAGFQSVEVRSPQYFRAANGAIRLEYTSSALPCLAEQLTERCVLPDRLEPRILFE